MLTHPAAADETAVRTSGPHVRTATEAKEADVDGQGRTRRCGSGWITRAAGLGLLALAGLSLPTAARAQSASATDRVIVRFAPATTAAERGDARAEVDASLVRSLPLPSAPAASVQIVDVGAPAAVADAVRALERNPDVRYAEPDRIVAPADVVPNDPYLSATWGLRNTGQTIGMQAGIVDRDSQVTDAWTHTTGAASQRVGILDTGVMLDHADLDPGLWRNPGESGGGRETNAVDDDANGRVDDARGWDFGSLDNDPSDVHGHGTHVAGTVGARGDDGIGVAGMAFSSTLLPVKIAFDGTGSAYTSAMAQAFMYAAAQGARVSNLSYHVPASTYVADALATYPDSLLVVAAGNTATNNDVTPSTCQYLQANFVCVAATDNRDNLASFSNYGVQRVHLGAPGVVITSAYPDAGSGTWATLSGTSMAAPHVAGAASLLFALRPALTARAARALLVDHGRPVSALAGKTISGRTLDAGASVAALLNPPAPAPAPPPPAPAPPPAPTPPTVPPVPTALPVPTVPTAPRPTPPPARGTVRSVSAVMRGRTASVSVACTARGPACAGTLHLLLPLGRTRALVLGRATFAVRPGATGELRLVLSPAAARLLPRSAAAAARISSVGAPVRTIALAIRRG